MVVGINGIREGIDSLLLEDRLRVCGIGKITAEAFVGSNENATRKTIDGDVIDIV